MMNQQPTSDTPAEVTLSPVVDLTNRETVLAILEEQFDYLLEHADTCEPGCSDCTRLLRIQEILLEPFRMTAYTVDAPVAGW